MPNGNAHPEDEHVQPGHAPRKSSRGAAEHEDELSLARVGLGTPPHSGLGIASSILALVALLLAQFYLVLSGVTGEEVGGHRVFLVLFWAWGIVVLTGFVLALIGVSQRRKKAFAILGLVANGLMLAVPLASCVCGGVAMFIRMGGR